VTSDSIKTRARTHTPVGHIVANVPRSLSFIFLPRVLIEKKFACLLRASDRSINLQPHPSRHTFSSSIAKTRASDRTLQHQS
jgi:hypothetical protein